MSVAEANIALWRLTDNSEAQDAEGYEVTCDECGVLVNEDAYGERDGLCEACYVARRSWPKPSYFGRAVGAGPRSPGSSVAIGWRSTTL